MRETWSIQLDVERLQIPIKHCVQSATALIRL